MTFLRPLLLSVLAFLAPIQTLLCVVFVLVLLDFITGVWAARKRGEEIKSAAMRRSVSKLFVYEFALLGGLLIQTLVGRSIPVVNLIAGMIGLVEGKSLLENLNVIYGGDLFKSVLEKLGSKNDTPKQ